MYDICGFPYPPEEAVEVLKKSKELDVMISITTKEMILISMIIPNPNQQLLNKFSPNNLDKIQNALGNACALEFQFLKEGYGYHVYPEGYDVLVGYKF